MKFISKIGFSVLVVVAIASIPLTQPASAQSSRLNIRQEGRLDRKSHKTHEFRGEFNQYVTISLNSSQFDSYLELYDTNGRLIAENDNALGTNSQIQINLPATGTYTVVVRGARNLARGNYTLAIREKGGLISVDPQHNQPPRRPEFRQTKRVEQRQINYHTFSGQAGETVTIVVESNQLNPTIVLYDPKEFAIASNNPSENRIRLKLSTTGTYRVGVQGSNPFEAGQYTLVINRS